MGLLAKIKGMFNMIFKNKAKKEFGVENITSTETDVLIRKCEKIYAGRPEWIDNEDHIKTINFAKSICSETARLATLAIGITLDGSARAEWLQKQIDLIIDDLRHWVEYGCAFGTIILKPNGNDVDLVTPADFVVTDQTNREITGIVFINRDVDSSGKKFYTRLEYHRFTNEGLYAISNRCYVGKNRDDTGKHIAIEETPWAGLQEDVVISNIDKPLYAVLKTPNANNIDIDSSMSISIFADAIEELKDLDIAYSRNAKEIFDSKRTVLLDSDRLIPSGTPVRNTLDGFENKREEMKLPDYVKNVYGDGVNSFYQEINPTLNTDTRIKGINALLSQIGYKCGYSNGYFVFDEKTGMVTATQVESDDRRTIQLIKDVRDCLQNCIDGLLYALNAFADLYDLAPIGTYETVYDFGDITYNRDEDRARWYSYVTAGRIPFWYYLVKFEGFSEDEAKALEDEARQKEPDLFGGEE